MRRFRFAIAAVGDEQEQCQGRRQPRSLGLSASKTLVSTLETSSRTRSEDPKRTPKLVKLVAKPQMAAVSSRSRKPLSSKRTMVALFMEAELSTLETRNQTLSSRDLLFAQSLLWSQLSAAENVVVILCCRAVSTKAAATVTSSAKAALDAERTTTRAVSLRRTTTAARICAMEG